MENFHGNGVGRLVIGCCEHAREKRRATTQARMCAAWMNERASVPSGNDFRPRAKDRAPDARFDKPKASRKPVHRAARAHDSAAIGVRPFPEALP